MPVAAGVRSSRASAPRGTSTRRASGRLESGKGPKPSQPWRGPARLATASPLRPMAQSLPAVPAAVAPVAKLGPKGALLAGAIVAGYLLWGWLNSRDKADPAEDSPEESFGQQSATGQSRFRLVSFSWVDRWDGERCTRTNVVPVNVSGLGFSDWGQYQRVSGRPFGDSRSCGRRGYEVVATRFDGSQTVVASVQDSAGVSGARFSVVWEFRNGAERSALAPVPLPTLPVPLPLPWGPEPAPLQRPEPGGDPLADPLTQPAAPELPPVPKAPPIAPAVPPDAVPLGPGTPGPFQAPGDTPTRFPVRPDPRGLPVPRSPFVPAPVGPQVGPDGELLGEAVRDSRGRLLIPVPVTDPETELFGDQVIGQPGSRPPSTPDGTARELGRLEQKLAAMRPKLDSPDDPVDLGPVLDRLAELEEKVEDLTAPLRQPFEGDSYELQPPCGRDQEGNPLPPDVAQWQGGQGMLLQLSRQVDALALLLQYAKDQRQPICKGKPIGEEVSVTFREAP